MWFLLLPIVDHLEIDGRGARQYSSIKIQRTDSGDVGFVVGVLVVLCDGGVGPLTAVLSFMECT